MGERRGPLVPFTICLVFIAADEAVQRYEEQRRVGGTEDNT